MFQKTIQTQNQQIHLSLLEEKKIELWIKREDLIHEFVSGNKFRKLKYNISEANRQNKKTLLTFGGAFSNHIVATAVAGKLSGFNTIGIVRGNELATKFDRVLKENKTINEAYKNGMKFDFVSREDYSNKETKEFIAYLKKKHGDFYLIPEGGTNKLAIQGCKEILTSEDEKFDYICVAVGTGGTVSGIINSVKRTTTVLGFSALKGGFLKKEIEKNVINSINWELISDDYFGGYAKINTSLVTFMNEFKEQTGVLLDPIYTGKMMFRLLDMIEKNQIKQGAKILAIHTGGIQGIDGINTKLKKKNLDLIKV